MIPYRHKKTEKRYLLLAHAMDCTNARDGTPVIVYCHDDDQNTIFVREEAEFFEKFEAIH
jgi:hypothetical protein